VRRRTTPFARPDDRAWGRPTTAPAGNLRSRALAAAEWLLPLGGVVCLTLCCVITSWKREFWNDELYSWHLLADPSFSHMLSAFGDAINNTPATYFLAGWSWAQLFGASELSLRLFSSIGFSIALLLFWSILRRVYGLWPTFIGCVAVFLTSQTVIMQNAEGRMYGLYAALAAAALLQYQRLTDAPRIGVWSLLGVAALHAALVNTHLFGLFYSLAILAAFVSIDLARKRRRPGLYAAVVAGQLSLAFYAPVFLRQSQAGIPRAWMPTPSFADLIELTSFWSRSFGNGLVVIALLLALAAIHLWGKALRRPKPPPPTAQQGPLLCIAVLLLLVPIGVWIVSRTVKPIFWDRYMLPSLFGYGIVFAHAAALITTASAPPGTDAPRREWLSLGLLTVTAAFLFALPVLHARPSETRGGFRVFFEQKFDPYRLPVALQGSSTFLEWSFYSPHPERYFYIADRQASLMSESGAFGAQQYKHMLAYRRQYPQRFGAQVIESDRFLSKFDRFLVIDAKPFDQSCPPSLIGLHWARDWQRMECPKWLELRILHNPRFKVTELGDYWGISVLLVEKSPAAGAPPPPA
jgi:hypothetical protein